MRAAIRRRRRPNGHAGMRRKRVRKSTSRKIEADWKRSNKECNSNMSVTSQRRRAERKQKVVTGTHRDVACWWDPYWASQCFAPAGFGSSSDDRRLTQPRSPQHHPPLPQRQPLLPQYQPPRPQRRAALLHRRSYLHGGGHLSEKRSRRPSRVRQFTGQISAAAWGPARDNSSCGPRGQRRLLPRHSWVICRSRRCG